MEERMEEILDDLCARFLLNVPEDDLSSFERICFQIEQAHWFYEDFYREQDSTLPGFSFQRFVAANDIVHRFKTYKGRVPVCGAILLNREMDKVLLVRGYTSKSSWSFPRGKINQDESESKCAIREVFEETSFDISEGIREKQYLEIYLKEQRIRLFLISNVPEDYPFAPRTRKEIGKIAWHQVATLPEAKGSKGNFFNVAPFTRNIKKWIRRHGKSTTTDDDAAVGRHVMLETDYSGAKHDVASSKTDKKTKTATPRKAVSSSLIFSDSDVPSPSNLSIHKKNPIINNQTSKSTNQSANTNLSEGTRKRTYSKKKVTPIIESENNYDIPTFSNFTFNVGDIMKATGLFLKDL